MTVFDRLIQVPVAAVIDACRDFRDVVPDLVGPMADYRRGADDQERFPEFISSQRPWINAIT